MDAMDDRLDPQLVCYCEEGEICRHCLGSRSGLLEAVIGGDGAFPEIEREPGSGCTCQLGEVCRHCLGAVMHDKVTARVSRPWRDAPEHVRQLATPSAWLEVMAQRN